MNILDVANNKLVEVEIIQAILKDMPLKKDGWHFSWRTLSKEANTRTYILRTIEKPQSVEGVLQLRTENDMLIMDLIEIAPHNIGSKNKKFDNVAGCLIAFACRESFKMDGDYQGFLTFVAKTKLIEWYINKYGAHLGLGQRMFIDPDTGLQLIDKYLE